MDNITLHDYSIVPKDYVCPICGHNFWDLDCPHSEWDIIQHFEKVVREYANHDNWGDINNVLEIPIDREEFVVWQGDDRHGYNVAEEALK